MDEIVKVRRSFLNKIRGFVNIFANECKCCIHKDEYGCAECDNSRAKELVLELDNVRDAEEEKYWIENPFEELMTKILKAVHQGGGMVRSQEIKVKGVGRQRKFRALNTLVRRGKLIKKNSGKNTFFVLAGNEVKTNNKKGNNKNGIQS